MRRCLDRSAVPGRFRLVRSDGYRAIAEVDQFRAVAAREAWTTVVEAPDVRLVTGRTWGTLVGAKRWLRRGASQDGRPGPSSR